MVAGSERVRLRIEEGRYTAALAVAEDYLRIVSWSFVASGIVFTCSSMFQGLGDTRPSLLASASRLLTFVLPAIWLTGQPFFSLHNVWLISLISVFAQMGICLLLLRAQFRRKLAGMAGEGVRADAVALGAPPSR